MKRKSFLAVMLMAISLMRCAAKSIAERPTPTTLPSTYVVKLSDAVALNTLQTEDLETNLSDKISSPQVEETTYFGEIDQFNEDEDKPVGALPIIALHSAETWTAVPLTGEGLRNTNWKYVGAGPAPKEIWGVLDAITGMNLSTFVMAHSIDGGATFEMTVFHKPCKRAQFFDFAMSRDGHGRASLTLEEDCGSHKAGVYHFETRDDGKTWSAEPRYEPDAMTRAEEVPDEEQPSESTAGTKTLFRSGSK
jgi:hypothetical protein